MDAQFFDALKRFIASRRRECEIKMAKQKLRHVDRYRERLIQYIKELELKGIDEHKKNS